MKKSEITPLNANEIAQVSGGSAVSASNSGQSTGSRSASNLGFDKKVGGITKARGDATK